MHLHSMIFFFIISQMVEGKRTHKEKALIVRQSASIIASIACIFLFRLEYEWKTQVISSFKQTALNMQ